MIKAYTTAAVLLVLAPSAALAQRAGDAALGAVAGAVVLGPVGAVAGAFVGYTAGPSISRSWGLDRSRSSRHRRQASKDSVRGARAEAIGPGDAAPSANARVATSRSGGGAAPRRAAPAKPSFPPVQTLD
ncbi:MAG TPA: DNA-directed RNA polymerase subunit N [Bradyrhizobium sp.]|nr:DNA-directed RNA polymerase subunit N [Bradyrhizobium sp.]